MEALEENSSRREFACRQGADGPSAIVLLFCIVLTLLYRSCRCLYVVEKMNTDLNSTTDLTYSGFSAMQNCSAHHH